MFVLNCKRCGAPLDIIEGARVCTCKRCGSSQTLPEFGNTDSDALLLLQEAEATWKQLAQSDFVADSQELRELAQKYEQIVSDPPMVASDAAGDSAGYTLAEKCANKAVYCRYLGAVSDLKRSEDPEAEENAYDYLVSLGDYEDAERILDAYRYKMLRTEKEKKNRKQNEYKGLGWFMLALAAFSLAFGIFVGFTNKNNRGGFGYFLGDMVQATLLMMVILCIPVALYLIGDRIAKWVNTTREEYEEFESDDDPEEEGKW